MEEKIDLKNSISWQEKYSDRSLKLLKQSIIVFVIVISLFILLFPAEYFLLLSFIAFLYTFLLGISSLTGLFLGRYRQKYYIQSIFSTVIALTLVFVHIYIAHAIIKGHKKSLSIAKHIVCSSNLESISSQYLHHVPNESWLSLEKWCDFIEPSVGLKEDGHFRCPVDKTGPCSYAMNENIPADANELPSDLVLLFESAPGWNQVGGADDVVIGRHKHNGKPGANIAFADGRVEFLEAEDIPTLRWTAETED